jgi:hypothetical protein
MKDLKVKLFGFKKGLEYEQSDVENIVEAHIKALDNSSEKRVIQSLSEKLEKYTYQDDVKSLVESLGEDLQIHELLYELKDLYKVVESRDNGMVYRHPLNVLLQIINLDNDEDRMSKIMNELAVYDWVPEIKTFIHNLTQSPEKRQNLLNGGSSTSVYTIVESVEEGHVAFLKDSWFLLKEDSIDKTVLEDHVKDQDKLRLLRTLESALKYAEISEERVDFKISESLTIGLSTKESNDIFINEEKVSKETTLENLFSSPIVPIVNKNFFPLIREVSSNLDKFVELDVVKHISNLTNPFMESFAFNFKDNVYLYTCDSRYGNSFYKYESAMELIDDVKNNMSYDLTYFYEDKISDEVKTKRKLEDRVREIEMNIDDLDKNIDKVETNLTMLGESKTLSDALTGLKSEKDRLVSDLEATKETMYKEVVRK